MKNYILTKTKDKNLFRLVDRNGDWQRYYFKPKNVYLRAVNAILEAGYAKGLRFTNWALSVSKEEAEKKLKSAGERGDRIHQAITLLIHNGSLDLNDTVLDPVTKTSGTLSPDEWDAMVAFQDYWNKHKLEVLDDEFPVYNLKYGYAGTSDAVVKLTQACEDKTCDCKKFIGQIGIWDWKSSGAIYDSYGGQVAAYGNGENLKFKPEYTAILRIGADRCKNGWQVEFYDKAETKKHWLEFLSAKQISEADYKPFNPEKEIVEIPTKLTLWIGKQKNSSAGSSVKVLGPSVKTTKK